MRVVDDPEAVSITRPDYSLLGNGIWLSCVLFIVLCVRDLTLKWLHSHGFSFQDDAYYYLVVAKHIAQSGRSTFDGVTLTNGYHPLWAALLALQYKVIGDSELLTRCIEYILGLGCLFSTLLLTRFPNAVLNLVFTVGLFWILAHISFNGMETALFAVCFGLFSYACQDHLSSSKNMGVKTGLLGVATVAARIDAVVFVLPQLLLANKTWSQRLRALCVLLACGFVYIVFNLHYFHVSMPISGAVKALGGLQINHPLLTQIGSYSQEESKLLYLTLALLFVSPLARRNKYSSVPPFLAASFAVGLLVFMARLCFFSSWRIWPWYDYPLLVGYIACFPAVLLWSFNKLLSYIPYRQMAIAVGVIFFLAFGVSILGAIKDHGLHPQGNFAINRKAIHDYGGVLNHAYVAMGDRAGNFAYQYSGGVDQLEGLMNDRGYYDLLKKHGDVKALLCQRGVQFVLSYEPDLQNYQNYQIETVRHELSQFPTPTIDVSRRDEVAKVYDVTQFNSAMNGDPKIFLYIWRLPCDLHAEQTFHPR